MKVEKGSNVSVHYTGTLNDGSEFDSSYKRGQPLKFEVGAGQMIPGFDNAVVGMSIGEVKEINLDSADAYGPRDEERLQVLPKTAFPAEFDFTEGSMVQARQPSGATMIAKIVDQDIHTATLDFNHPLAGQDLNFKIEIVEIS